MSERSSTKHVQVCLLTYRRPELLRLTLQSLQVQSAAASPDLSVHILVVDNHDEQSGRAVFDEVFEQEPFEGKARVTARYVGEPARGISTARNRALDESTGMDFVAFIDDDEVADPDWLSRLLKGAADFEADVTTGPVWPHYLDSPAWVVRGGFFNAVDKPTGTPIDFVATNNVLLRANVAAAFRFDSRFDSTGGEDTEFFMRIKRAGHRIIWVNEAIVSECIPPERANVRWLLSRARSDANRFTRGCLSVDGSRHTRGRRFVVACGGFLAGLVRLPLGLVGRRHAVRGLQLMWRSMGTVSALRGSSQIYYQPAKGQTPGQAGRDDLKTKR